MGDMQRRAKNIRQQAVAAQQKGSMPCCSSWWHGQRLTLSPPEEKVPQNNTFFAVCEMSMNPPQPGYGKNKQGAAGRDSGLGGSAGRVSSCTPISRRPGLALKGETVHATQNRNPAPCLPCALRQSC